MGEYATRTGFQQKSTLRQFVLKFLNRFVCLLITKRLRQVNFVLCNLLCRARESKCRWQLPFDDEIQDITEKFTNQI